MLSLDETGVVEKDHLHMVTIPSQVLDNVAQKSYFIQTRTQGTALSAFSQSQRRWGGLKAV